MECESGFCLDLAKWKGEGDSNVFKLTEEVVCWPIEVEALCSPAAV